MKNNNTLSQSGFTLLELMVAMTIFAVLAVAGWQVFDGLNRSKDRAQLQATALSEMQYAYLQIQKDMAQVVPYQLNSGASGSEGLSASTKESGLTLSANSISFIRFADPDPRYQNSALLERVVYRIADNRLVRQRFRSLSNIENQTPIESILLAEISEGHFQALTPEPVSIFPDKTNPADNLGVQQGLNPEAQQVVSPALLPKGITVDYVYQLGSQSVPISWQFSLTNTPPNPSDN